MDISSSILRSPSKTLRKLAQEEDVGFVTAHKAVREELKLFPYKVTAVQELEPVDHEKRIRYCEWFTNFIQTKTIDILDVTFFTDEAWFHLSVTLTHKTHDCGRRRILMLCLKNPCMTRNLECGLRYPDGALLALYSLKKQ
jgi:hypothetical protein